MEEENPFSRLVAVMARLRGPNGCPWDREQTLESLRTYLIEETYELLEAIDSKDPVHLQEELGDVLLEVVFLSQVCKEQGLFQIDDVVNGIVDKLTRRHPHVFGQSPVKTAGEALRTWEEVKNQERAATGKVKRESTLDGVPAHLPALMRAHRLSTKASLTGFDWKIPDDLHDKLFEEVSEFRQAAATGDREAMEEELGDILFTMANVGRMLRIDPELALQAANRKFIRRFHWIEAELRRRGIEISVAGAELMEKLWEEAKRVERADPSPENQSTSSR